MGRANIYINKENEARWNSISNKSGWVNEQVRKLNRNARMATPEERAKGIGSVELEPSVYVGGKFNAVHRPPAPNLQINTTKGTTVTTIVPQLTPVKKDDILNSIPKLRVEKVQNVCKIHGLPLDSRGRCLQKGCKYA